jgi:hypothetical protein
VVGFAAETQNRGDVRPRETGKEESWTSSPPTAWAAVVGFEAEDNSLTLIDAHGSEHLDCAPKRELARALVARIAARLPRTWGRRVIGVQLKILDPRLGKDIPLPDLCHAGSADGPARRRWMRH